jgi:hypothetical protein
MQSRWQQDAADGFAVLVRLLSEAKCLTAALVCRSNPELFHRAGR